MPGYQSVLTFAVAVFFLLITPGPGVLTTAGVGAAFGRNAGLQYVSGLCIGNALVGLAVVTGLAAVIFALPLVRNILLVLSALYLSYLAFRIATAGSKISFIEADSQPGFFSGVTLQTINPKAYAVNTALFSGFAILPDALLTETAIKFGILNAIWIPIHLMWLAAGIYVERMELASHIQFRVNMLMAGSLMVVVILAIYSLL